MAIKITCEEGTIVRNSYTRKLTKGKLVHVPANCIEAQSATGEKRSPVDQALITRLSKTHKQIRQTFGTPQCKVGEILREGYQRQQYTRKNGVIVKATQVGPKCIKATGLAKKTGKKGRQLFVLEKGTLSKYGYHSDLSEEARHEAIYRAMRDYGHPLSIFRKLNALYILNKNRNPTLAQLFRKDAKWVQTTEEYKNR